MNSKGRKVVVSYFKALSWQLLWQKEKRKDAAYPGRVPNQNVPKCDIRMFIRPKY